MIRTSVSDLAPRRRHRRPPGGGHDPALPALGAQHPGSRGLDPAVAPGRLHPDERPEHQPQHPHPGSAVGGRRPGDRRRHRGHREHPPAHGDRPPPPGGGDPGHQPGDSPRSPGRPSPRWRCSCPWPSSAGWWARYSWASPSPSRSPCSPACWWRSRWCRCWPTPSSSPGTIGWSTTGGESAAGRLPPPAGLGAPPPRRHGCWGRWPCWSPACSRLTAVPTNLFPAEEATVLEVSLTGGAGHQPAGHVRPGVGGRGRRLGNAGGGRGDGGDRHLLRPPLGAAGLRIGHQLGRSHGGPGRRRRH